MRHIFIYFAKLFDIVARGLHNIYVADTQNVTSENIYFTSKHNKLINLYI